MKLILIAVCGAVLWAQPKEFEVASIHPSPPPEPGHMSIGMNIDKGMLRASGMTAKCLIEQAYDVRDFQVIGGPSWIGSLQYDINAKIDGDPTNEQLQTMMQSLLADRFKLQVHREKKEMPCYALVVGKSGSKLVKTDKEGGNMSMSRGSFTGEALPVKAIVHAVEQVLGRAVIDKTGLTGNFDFKLEWTPDEARTGGEGASIFTALQEQLGLRLETTRGMVDVVVVDRLEKPTEN